MKTKNRAPRWRLWLILPVLLGAPALSAEPVGSDGRQKLLDAGVEEVVFACRTRTGDGHWYANFGYYFDGPHRTCFGNRGELRRLNVSTGVVSTILEDERGSIRDPQVHYDGEEILFSYRRGGESQYHLYVINKDGSGLRRLTDGIYDDIEPSYLPDGGIVFVSARSRRWVNCWQTQVASLYRCDRDGGNIRMLSANIEHDNTPWVLPDGRILYTRWEYVDRSQVKFHHLWTVNPDGTGQMAYFGNLRPGNVFIDAKPVLGTDSVVFIDSPEHGMAEHAGVVAVVSGKYGPDSRKSYRQISRRQVIRHRGDGYRDPFAISRDFFLVAHGRELLVLDSTGTESRVLEAPVEVHEPRPVMARKRERIIPTRVDTRKETGTVILRDVNLGRKMRGVERGEIKKLLVVETLPKPLNFGDSLWDFIPISHGGTFTLERILGTVPVEEDGSAYFELPANRPLFFIALDENGSSVKRMHSFLSVMPGETVGCVGCHEDRVTAPNNNSTGMPAALSRAPSRVTPVPGVPYVHDYPRDIQPVLDRHCVACHEPDEPSGGVLLTGDRGGIFSVSYFTLVSRRLVSDGRNKVGNSAPRTVGDSASPLMEKLSGSHHDAKPTPEEVELIRSWIHVGAPYPGTYAALGTGMLHQELPLPASYGQVRQVAQSAFHRRCERCHQGAFPELNRYSIRSGGHEGLLDSHFAFNLSRPGKSPLLLAPLARGAGGWGMPQPIENGEPTGEMIEIFEDVSDPDYGALLAYVEFGKTVLEQNKRWDMPGFKPSPHYVREMKRFGILPESFDISRDQMDAHEVDRRYWESSWHYPGGAPELHDNKILERLMVGAGTDCAWEKDLTAASTGRAVGPGERLEGESSFRIKRCTWGTVHPQSLRKYGSRWSGDSHLLWKGGRQGASLWLEFDVEEAGCRVLTLKLTKAPDYGVVQLYLDGRKLLEPLDLYATRVEPSQEIDAGQVLLTKGVHELKIVIVGANISAKSGGFGRHLCGLDYLELGEPSEPEGVGRRFPSERTVYTDKETGRRVVLLTASPADDVKIYQTHPSWTADGRWIVFNSDRTEGRQLFAVREKDGVIVQLTEEPGVNAGQVSLSRKRLALWTLIGRSVVRFHLETVLSGGASGARVDYRHVVASLPEDSKLSGTMSLDADEKTLYLGLEYPARPEADRWSIQALDLETGEYRPVLKPAFRVGHVQADPWDPGRLQYCHETGGDAPQRMWTVRADGTDNRPFYRETFDEWVTHEVWQDRGRALFTVWPKDDRMRRKPHGIASVSLEGDVTFHSRYPYWHVTGARGSVWAVADTFDGEVFRVDLHSGEKTLLTGGHRPGRKGAHPHPVLHPDGDRVLFNSNARGSADLCVVKLQEDGEPGPKVRARSYVRGTRDEAVAWQRKLRRDLLGLLRLSDLVGRELPLKPEEVSSEKKEKYVLKELELDSTRGRRIRVLVTVPVGGGKDLPAVVCIHGHGGSRRIVHDPSSVYKGFAAALAARGFVTISTDVGQHEVYEEGRMLMGERLWDLFRCVDYLKTLPEVDSSRIGCAGLSLGGEMAMWLGAMDERVTAVVSSGFLTTMDQMEVNHCMCWKFGGLRQLVDYADIYSLTAPRPLQCQNGLREGVTDFWVPLARHALGEIRGIYEDLGKPGNATLVAHEGGHEIALPSLLEFFDEHLRRPEDKAPR